MNIHSPKRRSRLTTKCQVTIPQEVRKALGLKALDFVDFEIDGEGTARIVKTDPAIEREEWLRRVKEVREKFKLQDPFAGMDGLEYQRWIRESPEV
jgi:AbrB family looped-hinge helix DNA binding protein